MRPSVVLWRLARFRHGLRYASMHNAQMVSASLHCIKLIKKGLVNGKAGSGESLVIDMSEDTVRTLVILDRAGVFDK